MSFFSQDLEHDLWKYCLKHEGRWWAKLLNIIPFFWWVNKEVKELYLELRALDPGTVICIVQDDGPDYQRHIDHFRKLKETLSQTDDEQPSVEGEPTYVNDPGFPDAVVRVNANVVAGLMSARVTNLRHCQFRFHNGGT